MSVIWSGVTEEGAVVPVQVTAEGKVVAVGDGPEGDYLKLTGGNLTGDLTVDEKITLKTDGSATFDDAVQIGNDPFGGNANGIKLYPAGGFYTCRAQGNQVGLSISQNGTLNPTTLINADGSANFAGGIESAGVWVGKDKKNGYLNVTQGGGGAAAAINVIDGGGSTNAVIKADGSATFARTLEVKTDDNNKATIYRTGGMEGTQNGIAAWTIRDNGSANFTGNVEAPNINTLFQTMMRLKLAVEGEGDIRQQIKEALQLIPTTDNDNA